MTTTSETFQRAVQCHQTSRWAEADALYRQVLATEPGHVDAQHLLGLLELQSGQPAAAAARIAGAIAALEAAMPPAPSHAALHLNLGTALQASDQGDAALASFRRACSLDPALAEAHTNLGALLQARGDLAGAVTSHQAALRARPGYAQAHFNLGNSYAAMGRTGDAIASYEAAVAARPDHAEALNNLGNMLQAANRLDAAIARHEAAVQAAPQASAMRVNLGIALRSAGRLDDAVAQYEQALALAPNDPEAHYNLANARYALGAKDAAEAGYARAAALRPGYAEAHYNLGALLQARGQSEPAVACYRRALAAQPAMTGALFNLANLLQDLGQLDEAVAVWQRLLAITPDHAEAHASLGNGLQKQGRIKDAVAAYRRALAIKPGLAEAHYNLGNALEDDSQVAPALDHYGRAIALRPDYVEAHWNRSLTLLRSGDLAAGWPEYEWRWRRPYSQPLRRPFTAPLWRGEPLEGKRILLHAEQGLGDTLQFCRYVALVRARRPAGIVLEVPPPLRAVMTDSFAGPDIEVVPMDPGFPRGDGLPPFDVQCPLMSLPLAFDTRLETIPAEVPYLRVDPARAAAWRDRLGDGFPDRAPGLRVGLVWAGGIRPNDPEAVATDRRRSIALDQLAPLAALSGVSWYSLQKGGPAGQAAQPPPGMALRDHMAAVEDFADTAVLAAALDLVISVDTSVAHLAGGLGVPVWLLSRFDGCWRWLLERDDSPWYPGLRLYRQAAPGDWTPVIDRLRDDLATRLASRRS